MVRKASVTTQSFELPLPRSMHRFRRLVPRAGTRPDASNANPKGRERLSTPGITLHRRRNVSHVVSRQPICPAHATCDAALASRHAPAHTNRQTSKVCTQTQRRTLYEHAHVATHRLNVRTDLTRTATRERRVSVDSRQTQRVSASDIWLALASQAVKKTVPAGCKDWKGWRRANGIQRGLDPGGVLLDSFPCLRRHAHCREDCQKLRREDVNMNSRQAKPCICTSKQDAEARHKKKQRKPAFVSWICRHLVSNVFCFCLT